MPELKNKAKFHSIPERALGDGNCAFNAFVLGLSQSSVIHGIEKNLAAQNKNPDAVFAAFVQAAANSLHIAATWDALKAELLKRPIDEPQKDAFQQRLAPLFRNLSIDLLQADNSNRDNSIEALNIEYQNFVYKALGVKGREQGDFCRAHPLVQKKFADLFAAAKSNLLAKFNVAEYEQAKASNDAKIAGELEDILKKNINISVLDAWWIAEGYDQFCEEMRKPGMHGGDFELEALAKYFEITLIVRGSNDCESMRHSAHGTLIVANNAIARALSDRGIARIKGEQAASVTVELFALDKEEMTSRLNQISHYADVMNYLVNKHPVRGDEISINDFSLDCLEQLKLRGVLSARNNKYYFAVDATIAESRINKIDTADDIMVEWSKNYRDAPTIMLSNPHGKHWNNVPLVGAVVPVVSAISSLSEDEKKINEIFDAYFEALEKAQPSTDSKTLENKIETALESVESEASKLVRLHGIFSIPKGKGDPLTKVLDEVVAETEKLKKSKP